MDILKLFFGELLKFYFILTKSQTDNKQVMQERNSFSKIKCWTKLYSMDLTKYYFRFTKRKHDLQGSFQKAVLLLTDAHVIRLFFINFFHLVALFTFVECILNVLSHLGSVAKEKEKIRQNVCDMNDACCRKRLLSP